MGAIVPAVGVTHQQVANVVSQMTAELPPVARLASEHGGDFDVPGEVYREWSAEGDRLSRSVGGRFTGYQGSVRGWTFKGEDYFVVRPDEIRRVSPDAIPGRGGENPILLAESGYLMLVAA